MEHEEAIAAAEDAPGADADAPSPVPATAAELELYAHGVQHYTEVGVSHPPTLRKEPAN